VLGEEIAALQSGEDIAQSDVARRPRHFEAATPTEPGADQPEAVVSGKRRRPTTGLVFALSTAPPHAPMSADLPTELYFGHGGNPGLPHACGCATGGCTRTTGGG
jgi:hypothetical protein